MKTKHDTLGCVAAIATQACYQQPGLTICDGFAPSSIKSSLHPSSPNPSSPSSPGQLSSSAPPMLRNLSPPQGPCKVTTNVQPMPLPGVCVWLYCGSALERQDLCGQNNKSHVVPRKVESARKCYLAHKGAHNYKGSYRDFNIQSSPSRTQQQNFHIAL